ncbi:hypothetical protein CLV24_108151 [Pontibacter ummariensis]|uniref:Uncharacterized protein n=1 Tax=Pontibacter ummariensis TaxID=1610492 RepID=A0A239F6G1_9BACT|nr:hypothetical protein CLV24_108151 [Pontibacter ummariensis]SNS52387.1 hypothetical protein SAMN06296052_10834 [Pontibacter ummariensis]
MLMLKASETEISKVNSEFTLDKLLIYCHIKPSSKLSGRVPLIEQGHKNASADLLHPKFLSVLLQAILYRLLSLQ